MLNQALRGGPPLNDKIDGSSSSAGQRSIWALDGVLKPFLVTNALDNKIDADGDHEYGTDTVDNLSFF
jgi:hypothetical protein